MGSRKNSIKKLNLISLILLLSFSSNLRPTNSQILLSTIEQQFFNQLGIPQDLQDELKSFKLNSRTELLKDKNNMQKNYNLSPAKQAELWQKFMAASLDLKKFILDGKFQNFLTPSSSDSQDLDAEPGQTIFTNVSSPLCVNHTIQLFSQFTSLKGPAVWSLQMVDSWGKFPDGIFSGHTSSLGDFEECLQIRANIFDENDPEAEIQSKFKGRYCSTYLLPDFEKLFALLYPNPLKQHISFNEILDDDDNGLSRTSKVLTPMELLTMMTQIYGYVLFPQVGTCFPSTCPKEDVQQILSNIYSIFTDDFLMQLVNACYTDEKEDLDTGTISMIVILAVIGSLCILGTLADVLFYQKAEPGSSLKGTGMKSLVAFSVYTNTLKWMNTDAGRDNLGCLHGLRFLSMCWVVLSHTWVLMYVNQFVWNTVEFATSAFEGSVSILAIINGTVSVDTFFVISGTLASYNILKLLDKTRGKLNIPLLYLHRYLRLTPTYMLLLGIIATLMPYAGSGPNWYMLEMDSKMCRKYWWHNLLYITNVVKLPKGDAGCYGEAWYLSNDMQFFLLSPFIVYPIWKWKKIGLSLLALLNVASVIVPTVIKYQKELPPTLIISMDPSIFMQDLYVKPWCRIGPYLVGIYLGYILNHESKSKSKIQSNNKKGHLPLWVIAGWLSCTLTALAIIFGIQSYLDPANEVDTLTSFWSAIYGGFHRYVWGMCIAWIIYACVNGCGGWINDFLSWKPFIPLGRLTFCVYMVSYHLQMIFHQTTLTAWHYSTYIGMNMFFAHLVTSLLVGYVCTMALESPFMQLEKLIFPQGGPKSKPPVKSPVNPVDDLTQTPQQVQQQQIIDVNVKMTTDGDDDGPPKISS